MLGTDGQQQLRPDFSFILVQRFNWGDLFPSSAEMISFLFVHCPALFWKQKLSSLFRTRIVFILFQWWCHRTSRLRGSSSAAVGSAAKKSSFRLPKVHELGILVRSTAGISSPSGRYTAAASHRNENVKFRMCRRRLCGGRAHHMKIIIIKRIAEAWEMSFFPILKVMSGRETKTGGKDDEDTINQPRLWHFQITFYAVSVGVWNGFIVRMEDSIAQGIIMRRGFLEKKKIFSTNGRTQDYYFVHNISSASFLPCLLCPCSFLSFPFHHHADRRDWAMHHLYVWTTWRKRDQFATKRAFRLFYQTLKWFIK